MNSHEQITLLLLRWNEQRRRGQEIAVADLCQDCPDLLSEVQRGIDLLQLVETLLPETLDEVAPGPAVAAPRNADRSLPVVPGYVILGRLGEGGMGVVYKAIQLGLSRPVALKMILAGAHASPQHLDRFRREAEAVAQLRHPNIVQIYDIGEHDGRPYFSLEYAPGGSLDKKLQAGPLTEREAARLVRALAQAMHSAHVQGIIHRDLKPANILLTAEGTPKIADFGLAKQLAGGAEQTHSGAILGTPSYMAPEQAAGKIHELGPAVDIYALGAILYELLTGRPPFRAARPLDTVQQVLTEEPLPPRLLNSKVERNLDTICLTCLSKEPLARYPSALALADDLARYLNGAAIAARQSNILDDLTRVLGSSHHEPIFQGLAPMLGSIGLILLLSHLATLLLMVLGVPYPGDAHQAVRAVQFLLIAVVLWRHRQAHRHGSMKRAEQQLWAIWIGFGLGGITIFVIGYLQHSPKGTWPPIIYPVPLFPYWSVLSGLAFFALGSSYSGLCYLYGLAFFLLAAVMPLQEVWSPLAFGLLWSLALIGYFLAFEAARRRAAGGAAVATLSSAPAAGADQQTVEEGELSVREDKI